MQNILFIVGINHDKAASRLIMVTQEPSLDSLTHGISFTSLRLALFGNSATRIAELDSVYSDEKENLFLESNESGLFQNQISLTNLFGKVLLSAHLCSAFGRQGERKGFLPLQGRYRSDFKCHSLNIELTQPKCNNTRDRTP